MRLIDCMLIGIIIVVSIGFTGILGFEVGREYANQRTVKTSVLSSTADKIDLAAPNKGTSTNQKNDFEDKRQAFITSARDKPSPSKWIPDSAVDLTQDQVIINLEDARWARFSDTKSMDPVIDSNSIGIEIEPKNKEDIHVGDVVSYFSPLVNATIIHRVIEVGEDNEGWYARFKGDNNNLEDPGLVRWPQIRRVLVAVIY
jgi:hypothetical protein